MQDKPVFVSLIELAPIYVALDGPAAGGLWKVVMTKRHEGTGRDVCDFAVSSPSQVEVLRYVGPTITGLGESQLQIERERLERIRQATDEAIQAIDAALAIRNATVQQVELDAQAWTDCIQREPEAITVEFRSGGRSVVVVLQRDGETLAREYGGAIYSFGQQVHWPKATVNAWRSRGRPDLHEMILSALVEMGFPDIPMEPLYPDEHPSTITLRHRNGASESITAPRRLLRSKPILEKIDREIDAICYATQTNPSTHNLPNPELDR